MDAAIKRENLGINTTGRCGYVRVNVEFYRPRDGVLGFGVAQERVVGDAGGGRTANDSERRKMPVVFSFLGHHGDAISAAETPPDATSAQEQSVQVQARVFVRRTIWKLAGLEPSCITSWRRCCSPFRLAPWG